VARKTSTTTKKRGSRSSAAGPRFQRGVMRVYESAEAADQADREYWWSRTPAERLRELGRGHLLPLEMAQRPGALLDVFMKLRQSWIR